MKSPQQDFMSTTEIIAGFVGWVAGVASFVVGERLNAYFNRLKMSVIPSSQILTNTSTKHSETMGFGITIEQGKDLEMHKPDLIELFIRGGKRVNQRQKLTYL